MAFLVFGEFFSIFFTLFYRFYSRAKILIFIICYLVSRGQCTAARIRVTFFYHIPFFLLFFYAALFLLAFVRMEGDYVN